AHQQRRRRLIAAHQQHDAVERIRAYRFLDVHCRLVAKQHRGGPHQRLAEAHYRKLDRETSAVEHAVANVLRELAEMRIARRRLRPRVANADHGPAIELIVRNALVFHPRAVDETIAVVAAEPGLRPESALRFAHEWIPDACGFAAALPPKGEHPRLGLAALMPPTAVPSSDRTGGSRPDRARVRSVHPGSRWVGRWSSASPAPCPP